MATVNKDFKIKSGLIVEGTTATVNGNDILTETAGDAYILNLVGGATLITSVKADDFTVTGGELTIAAGSDIARDGDITTAIDALTTADIEEGTGPSPKYFTDQRALDATASAYDASGAASTVQGNLDDHATDTSTHGVTGDIVGTSDTQILTNKTINDATFNVTVGLLPVQVDLAVISGATGNIQNQLNNKLESADLTGFATETYVNDAVSNLVDAAPEMLNTLNELAAAIGDDSNYATTVSGLISGKQDNLTAGSNIQIASNTISVTGLAASDISDFNSAAVSATESSYDPAGTAAGLINDASNASNEVWSAYKTSTEIGLAQQAAIDHADALDTDDILEAAGATNLYFTDGRAEDAAGNLLANASTSNISITYDESGLHIDAENGVAGSTTDDLVEGETNLYFTDEKAIAAIDTVAITPGSVQINNWRKEESEQLSVANTSTVNVHSFQYPYESAKYLVRVVGWDGGVKHSQMTEILMTVDGNKNIAMTEYGSIHTSTSPLATFSATDISQIPADFIPTLTATTAVSGCEIIVSATLLSWAD